MRARGAALLARLAIALTGCASLAQQEAGDARMAVEELRYPSKQMAAVQAFVLRAEPDFAKTMEWHDLAKFSAALLFYLVMWLPMLGCLFVVQYYARQSGALEPGTLISMYLGIALIGGLFLSLGCFASALTRSQVVAAMVASLLCVSFFALGYLAEEVTASSSWQARVLSHFALFQQMQDFSRGVVDTRTVVLYLSLTFLFLFLTLRAVESRRWR